jgi:hypothetical protein
MPLEYIDIQSWEEPIQQNVQNKAIQSLENGHVLYFPSLPFSLHEYEQCLLSPKISDPKSKNVSYDIRKDSLRGAICPEKEALQLKAMLKRYAHTSRQFLERLIPHYSSFLIQAKTSFRPVEISGRKTSSFRKDDTRLHVDSFPSNPTKGYRILRIFTNINHEGNPRVWRLGEPFNDVVEKMIPRVTSPIWALASLYKWLGITKDYRTPYDHYMLQIHNLMKGDNQYQKTVPQSEVLFPPGSTWIVFTDQVSHAAMSGQHVLEQTFHLPADGIKNISTNPLKVLEKRLNKTLI